MEKEVIVMNLISVSDKKVFACGNSKLICSISVFFCSPVPVFAKCSYKYVQVLYIQGTGMDRMQ